MRLPSSRRTRTLIEPIRVLLVQRSRSVSSEPSRLGENARGGQLGASRAEPAPAASGRSRTRGCRRAPWWWRPRTPRRARERRAPGTRNEYRTPVRAWYTSDVFGVLDCHVRHEPPSIETWTSYEATLLKPLPVQLHDEPLITGARREGPDAGGRGCVRDEERVCDTAR